MTNSKKLDEETLALLREAEAVKNQLFSPSIDDQIRLGDFELRKEMSAHEMELRKKASDEIIDLFKKANKIVLFIACGAAILDYFLISFTDIITPEQRLISKEVIMTLIGATTVQVGAIMLTISRYLFPQRGQ